MSTRNGDASEPTFWAAPDLIGAGYWVFPVKDKEPLVAGGFYGATDDKSQVAAWIEDGRGDYDIAVPTGAGHKIVVIDADTPESFAGMEAKHGPPSYTTKRGGHWVFRHPRNGKVKSTKIGPGLDRKGDGGYAVFPPSRGRRWTDGIPRPEDLPMLPREFWPEKKEPTPGERTLPKEAKAEAIGAVARRVAEISPNGAAGGRHDHMRHLCGFLLRNGMSQVDAEDVLVAAWEKVGGELGERAPTEIPNALATTGAAIENGAATGGPSVEEITPGLCAELEDALGWRLRKNGKGPSSSSQTTSNDDGDDGAARKPFELVRMADVKRPSDERPVIVRGVLPQRWPSILFGDGGSAKSLIGASLLLDVARGADVWMGHSIECHAPVVYLDFELDLEEQARRLYQLAEGRGLEALPKDLYYASGSDRPAGEVLERTKTLAKEAGACLVMLDSLAFALDGDAEAARDVLGFVRRYIKPYEAAGIAVLIVDHQSKLLAGESYHQKSPFGSVFKSNSCRSVMQVGVEDQRDEEITVRFRHKKANFGGRFEPFDARLVFSGSRIDITHRALDESEVVAEGSLNLKQKVRRLLKRGPMLPDALASELGVPEGSVKNALTRLRKDGEVEDTGAKSETGAHQVRLVPPSSSSLSLGGNDGDDGNARGPVGAFLADLPAGMREQARRASEDPDRHAKPFAAAVADRALGSSARWQEAKPAVDDWLAKLGKTHDG